MKSITIRGIDEELDEFIRSRASRDRISLNQTIKKLLKEAVGISYDDKNDRKKDFTDIFGVWSQADLREFEQAVEDFGKIDPGDWR